MDPSRPSIENQILALEKEISEKLTELNRLKEDIDVLVEGIKKSRELLA